MPCRNFDAVAKAGGCFLSHAQDVAILDQQRLALGQRGAIFLHLLQLGLQLVDACAEVFQRSDHRLDSLRTQTEFFDQHHRSTTTLGEPRAQAARRCAILSDLLVAVR